jgi:hypothetical protein
MRHNFLFLVLLLAPSTTMAQAPVCSEQKIRDAAQKPSAKYSDDSFWGSGAYDKPMIGKAEQEAGARKLENEEPRKNEASADHPQRIVVAKYGDMAYEYGSGNMSYEDQKTGKHVMFQTAYLRVWKSVDGECKVAAFMIRPIESTVEAK